MANDAPVNTPDEPEPMEEQDRLAQPVGAEQPPRLSFPVIGMGASAGGLEAFSDFFKFMPCDSGMAFVLIQHLPPERESLMAEILGKRTDMNVREVEDGMPVEPNHVYVIRPGRTLTIHNGALHLGEPLEQPGHRHPVDDFFRSLAEEQRQRAVCVIMSGMGSNGTAGSQAIKAVGGVCIAQDVVTFVDITQRTAAEEETETASQRAQDVLDQMPAAVLLAELSGQITFTNTAVDRILNTAAGYGYSREDYRHWPFLRQDGSEYPAREMPLSRAIERGEVVGGELMRFRRPDASEVLLAANAAPIRNSAGAIIAGVMACTDVTESLRAQRDLLESEQRYRSLVEALEEGVLLVDQQCAVLAMNPAAERVLKLTVDRVIGLEPSRWPVTFVRQDRTAFALDDMPISVCLRDGKPCVDLILGALRTDGSITWLAFNCAPLFRDAKPKPYAAVCSFADITQRKHAEDSLRVAKTAAETANNAKDQFLATVSHELRTPLSAIALWTRILAEKPSKEAVDEAIKGIEHGVKAQKRLIEDLIDSARIATGKLRLELEEIELSAVIDEAIRAIRPTAQNKGVQLNEQIEHDVGKIIADPTRLEQVLWNLLTNAVKFTPSGGRVDVSVRRKDAHIEIRVADTGRGIAPELLPQVFIPFRQADFMGPKRMSDGLGLGLSIVKEVVELHGGTISITSPGVDQGTTATVRLPLPNVESRRLFGARRRPKDSS